jgi:hypothetical protein
VKIIWRGLKGFGAFWVDFLIGDSPEIAVGVVIILVIAFLLQHTPLAAAIILPVGVVSLLTFSLFRGKKRGD